MGRHSNVYTVQILSTKYVTSRCINPAAPPPLTMYNSTLQYVTFTCSGRKEGRKSLFGKVYIISCYLQYSSFSLEDNH